MTSLLLLLGMLSVATVLARRGAVAYVTHVVATPLLLGLGALLSPRGLAFLTPSTLDALVPALRVGVAWLAVLAGLSAGARPDAAAPASTAHDRVAALVASIGGMTTCIAAAWGALFAVEAVATGSRDAVLDGFGAIGVAVLLGGVLAPSSAPTVRETIPHPASPGERRLHVLARRQDIGAALATVAAMLLLPVAVGAADTGLPPFVGALLAPALGALLAAVQLLAGGRGDDGTTRMITLTGVVTLCAGVSARAHLPTAVVGFACGLLLARAGSGAALGERVASTERPVRLVVVALIGAHLGVEWQPALVGVIVAFARLAWKGAVVARWLGRTAGLMSLSAVGASSSSALMFVASIALAAPGLLVDSALLSAAAAAVVATDVTTLGARAWARLTGPPDESVDGGASP